ncbi:hypothetical protein QM012_005083 [Aureobasidium pullulans]|uniref:Amino acid transporter n=1 Tax=Aureobasidium pullulans TaxID=5580 RepID=A0ABR0T7K3_AURPU
MDPIDEKRSNYAEASPTDLDQGLIAHIRNADLPTTLRRDVSTLSIIGLGMSICNGWAAMSSTIVIGLAQGGTVTILYGLIGIAIINLCVALSIGEVASAYPSAGGQYIWSALLAKTPRARKVLSFVVGWVTVFEWLTVTASVVIILAQVTFAIVQLLHPDFVIAPWQVYVVYLAVNIMSVTWNIFGLRKMPWIGKVFFYFSSAVFISVLVAVVAKAPSYQSNTFVWGTYTNKIGWTSPFVVVSTGPVNPGYVYAGLDGAVHIAEEVLNPKKVIPLALLSTVGMAFITGFAISIALAYTIQDLAAAASSELPFLTIIVQATQSNAAGVVLMVAFLFCLFVSANSVHHATGRLIWSFAKDDALPFSGRLKTIHPTLGVPVMPLIVSGVGVAAIGAVYVGSAAGFTSIIACSIILGNVSYAIPAAQLLLRKRDMSQDRWLKLGWLGGVANVVVIVYTLFSTVMWLFPLPPKPSQQEMNYSIAVLGGMAVVAALDWLFMARKRFVGPRYAEVLEQ